MHPIFFGLRRAGCRRLKSSTNTLFAVKSCIENSRGAVQIPRLEALSRRRLNNRIGMHATKICRSQGNWTRLCMQRTRRKTTGPSPYVKGGGALPVLHPKLTHQSIPIVGHVKEIVRFVKNCLTKSQSCRFFVDA